MRNQLLILALNIFLFICILLVVLQLYLYITENTLDLNFNFTNITSLILIYSLIFLCSCQAWKTSFKSTTGKSLKFTFAISQTAHMLTSKYVPGKIWGFVARGISAPMYGHNTESTIHASIFEQIITIQSGFLLGVSLLAYSFNEYAGILLFIFFHIIHFHIYSLGVHILLFPVMRIPIIAKKIKNIEKIQQINVKAFTQSYYYYSLLWILIVFSLSIFLELLVIEYNTKLLFAIGGAYIISVLAGFLAIFAPGGIGVREGAFVALTLNILPMHDAIEISILIRIVLTIYDLIAGVTGHLTHVFSSK